jgi:hypothetical protein
MRKSLWIIALVFAAIGAPNAHADVTEYTINFTGGSPNPTSGSFDFDNNPADLTPFSDFTVVWEGLTFDLTSAANSAFVYGVPPCISAAGAQAAFQLLTVCADDPSTQWVVSNAMNCCDFTEMQFLIGSGQNGVSIQSTIVGSLAR